MKTLSEVWAAVKAAFEGVERAIVDVASWDGSAGQWATADEYCADCLIDSNSAAGQTEKTKALCYLPIRRPEDGAGDYVRQAVHACAGGRGITRLVKPENVPQADWDRLVKAAANKIIALYGEMDEEAPDSIYELAGKAPPQRSRDMTQRDIGLSQIAEQVMMQIEALANSAGAWPQIHDFYTAADGSLSIVFSMGGQVYQAPVTMQGTSAILGSITEVETMFAPVRSISIVRQADGRARWVAVAAASVLNRMAEIDSRALFDSFIARAPGHGYPQLRFYHDARMVLGATDWLERADNLYLASGLVADNELGAAFIDACEQSRGVWGCSIGFLPTKPPEMVEIARGLPVPVYVEGVNTEISVLPEDSAASWFTTIGLEVTRAMDEAKKKALITLLGDEERAKKFIDGVDATNRSITEAGLVTRETPEPPNPAKLGEIIDGVDAVVANLIKRVDEIERHATSEAEKAAKLSAEEKAQYEADLTAKILAAAGLDKLAERLAQVEETLKAMSKTEERLKTLEADLQERQRIRREDLGRTTVNATYRPRDEHAAAIDEPVSAASIAEKTLAALKH